MKKLCLLWVLSFAVNYYLHAQTPEAGKPVEAPEHILKDFNSFWSYINEVVFFEDFTAFDTASAIISKEDFLSALKSGQYLPLKLHTKAGIPGYRLHLISPSTGIDIMSAMKGWAAAEYFHYKMEGEKLPAFDFTDLEGRSYNPENNKGKILVIKCWFVNCQPCVAEMPELNKMVSQYKKRDDIIFVSLALDPEEKLRAFVKKKKFKYAVVASQRKYIMQDLHTVAFPTHIVVNKEGLIVKVVNEYAQLESILLKESKK